MKKSLKSILSLLAFLFVSNALAAVSPLSVSLVPPLQFPPEDFTVTGVRASLLWGNHRNFYGVDFGLLGNVTQQDFVGLGVSGLFNITHGSTTITGLQLAGVTNVNTSKTNVVGVQAALVLNSNSAASSVSGLQIAGIANLSPFTDIYGIQAGLYNKAQDVYGLQIGLVNVASSLHGVQIGLLNFNQKGTFVVSPILNVGF